MSILLTIFYFIVVLTIIVFVHEFGHFIVAKKCGVKIEEFSIGMGKKLFCFKDKSGVLWKFCCLPIGGYVKMYGDDNVASFGGYSDNPSENDLKYSLIYKHPLKKVAVAFAGPFMNFVLAIILFFAVFSVRGKPVSKPIVSGVVKNSQAEKAGVLVGDRIVSINSHKIKTFNDIRFQLQYSNGKKLVIDIIRDDKTLKLETEYNKNEQFGVMSDKVDYKQCSLSQALNESVSSVVNITVKTMQAVWNIVFHQIGLKNIGGPIAIAKESAKAGNSGMLAFVYFIGLISVSLGAINLLPVPLLDGGHVVVNLAEFITRRRLSNFAYKIFVYIGLSFIILLMGLGFINDLFINR